MDIAKSRQNQLIINSTRKYFQSLNFEEFTTPILNHTLPIEQNLYSFTTQDTNSKDKYYLPCSPEFYLKKALSLGSPACFSISPSFRMLETEGKLHHSEFIMLEWYRSRSSLDQIITDCQNIILFLLGSIDYNTYNRTTFELTYQNYQINLSPPWKIVTLDKLWSEYLPTTPIPDNEPDFNQLFLNFIEPHLPIDKPLFVTHYPSFLTPLASIDSQKSKRALRFELYISGIEIANGNMETSDKETVLTMMEKEAAFRRKNDLPTHPLDNDFVNSLSNLQQAAGCGLGLERLSMIFNNRSSI